MRLLPKFPALTPILPKMPSLFAKNDQQQWANEERELLHQAAKIGGDLFGPIPKGHRREFFCLDDHTWYWHEEWIDQTGQRQVITTRYDVRPGSIVKSQGQQMYQPLSRDEARNLLSAVMLYRQRVGSMYGNILQAAY